MKEIWKDIEGYEGLYKVSTKGRVESSFRKPHLLKLHPAFGGRLYAILSNGIKQRRLPVHRLVAKAFIPNPDNLRYVNHKDECVTNNCVDNLEWCTHKYNVNYGTRNERASATKRKRLGTFNRYVIQMTLDGKEIARYKSCYYAGKATGICNRLIYRVCSGKTKRHTTGGYRWAFVET